MFFFFSKSFISSTCRYITFTRPFIHVLQKKAPRKHPQYINKINDNANNSNQDILLSKETAWKPKKEEVSSSFYNHLPFPFVYELLSQMLNDQNSKETMKHKEFWFHRPKSNVCFFYLHNLAFQIKFSIEQQDMEENDC